VIVGVPKEVKDNEYRVALTPEGAGEFTHAGHRVLIQDEARLGSNIPQERYERVGAEIAPNARAVWEQADPALAKGLNTHAGSLTSEPVAEAHGLDFVPIGAALPGVGG
jgi:alanine dehydrogenase